jgi:P-type E1-E2 ATPase
VVDGTLYLVGSPRLLVERGIDLAPVQAVLDAVHASGATPVLLADEVRVLAVLGLADSLRPDAARALDRLRASGLELVMLTGDSEPAARRVARELGIEHRAGLLPEDKLAAIHELRERHGPSAWSATA